MKAGWAILAGAAVQVAVAQAADVQLNVTIGDLRRECFYFAHIAGETSWSVNKPSELEAALAATRCAAYVSAARDLVLRGRSSDFSGICLPEAATLAQLALVYVTWADANPQTHHLPRIDGLMEAWSRAFPCP